MFRESRDSVFPISGAPLLRECQPRSPILPDGPTASSDVEAMEEHDAVERAIPLQEYPDRDITVVDRFLLQVAAAGYILECFPWGCEIVTEVAGEEFDTREQVAGLVTAGCEWHEEIAEMAGTAAGRDFRCGNCGYAFDAAYGTRPAGLR